MLETILKKWWVILLQGILMILLGIFILNNPIATLAGISLWVGLIVLAIGLIGLIGWFRASKEDRESGSLLWSVVTTIFGALMLTNLLATMKTLTIIFGIWVLVTGYNLISTAWSQRKDGWHAWLMILVGIFSIIAGFMMVTNIALGSVGISTLIGIQVLLAGISLVVLAFLKKHVVKTVEGKIDSLKSKLS